ncbi:MAG: Fic family protein [Desulfohalobiaceae bacterium]
MSAYDWSRPALTPVLPGPQDVGPLKDMAQEVAVASAGLEESLPRETSRELGRCLRLVNSYYSNLIEGHKTTIPEIEQALDQRFAGHPERRYAQELCAAHVRVEQEFMDGLAGRPGLDVCAPGYIRGIHRRFYAFLPGEHHFTHHSGGFTDVPVMAGTLRDGEVSLDNRTPHGPPPAKLPGLMQEFARSFDPDAHHGDERLIAAAVSHHRLAWLHPFRDGNGRVARLHTSLLLARHRVNTGNLWSLSRGFSRNKQGYMLNLNATDSPGEPGQGTFFHQGLTADFCRFFFEICLDQISFMDGLLDLKEVEARIEWMVEDLIRTDLPKLAPEASRLVRSVFRRGSVPRGEVPEITNMPARTARRNVVAPLLAAGLLKSATHRAPLTMGLPVAALRYIFPSLFDPSVIGAEYREIV